MIWDEIWSLPVLVRILIGLLFLVGLAICWQTWMISWDFVHGMMRMMQ
jgi:hypothetical protein